MMPIVSVVIPIYKAEETLLRCLDSLKAQTFIDFEVLMVDDGSPDRCGEMIDEYAAKDARFKAYHKPNGGVSSARQYGIEYAQGVYTIHVDPDDWVETNMLEELYKKAQEDNADMVICDFYENTYKGQKYVKQQPSQLDHLTVQKELFQHLHGSCWNKLIRRSCYTYYNIRFPEDITFCEDLYVIASILNNKIIVDYLPKAFYHYVRNNDGSLSRRYTSETYQEGLRLREMFKKLLEGKSICGMVYDQKSYAILSKAFYSGKDYYSSATFKETFKDYKCYLEKVESSNIEKMLIRLSLAGLYRPMVLLFIFVIKVKHLFFFDK